MEPPPGDGPTQRPPTILVVDDEDLVLRLTSSLLTRFGYGVLTASDGEDGLDLYRARRGEIDAVILDETMPSLKGTDVLARLRSEGFEVPVLIATGLSSESIQGRVDAFPPASIIQKPFRKDGLREAVERLLQAS